MYIDFVRDFAALCAKIDAHDATISNLNSRAPNGERRRLLGVELAARGLGNFDRYNPPLRENLRLPDLACTSKIKFPPLYDYSANFALRMAEIQRAQAQKTAQMFSADWWEVQKVEDQRKAEEIAAREAKQEQQKLAEREEYYRKMRESQQG
jgi:hypothetical protein